MPDPIPNPPRYRWLRRLGLCVLFTVVGLVLLRLYWGQREQAELDGLVEDLRVKGYPVLFEDLAPASVPGHENMASYVQQAFNAVPYVNARGQVISQTDWYNEGGRDLFEEHQLPDPVTDNAAYLAQFQPVLEALRKAAACTRTDWYVGQTIPRPAYNLNTLHLSDIRLLTRCIVDAAERAVLTGDYPLAIDLLGHLMTAAQSLRGEPYTQIDHLVMFSIRARAADAVQRLLPQLPDAPALAGPLKMLNEHWLDEQWAMTGLAQAMAWEFWLMYDLLAGVLEGQFTFASYWGHTPDQLLPLDYAPTRWLARPYYQDDLSFITRYYTHLIKAAEGATNKEDYDELLGHTFDGFHRQLDDADELFAFKRPFAYEMIWGSDSVSRTHFRHLATSRMCATAIALKRYAIDHGERPDTLAALVPDYLPAVPDDPFVRGRSITYLPQGASPKPLQSRGYNVPPQPLDPEVERRAARSYPLLYCVGNDGKDNGGLFPIRENSGVIDGWFNGRDTPTDWCFFLVALPKPIPDPNATPFGQHYLGGPGGGLGGPSLPGASNTPASPAVGPGLPGQQEQIDEEEGGGQGDEDEQPPAQPE